MPPGLMARLRFWLAAPEERSRAAEHPAAGGSPVETPLETEPGAPDPEDDAIGSSGGVVQVVAPVPEAPTEKVALVPDAPAELPPAASTPARPPAAAPPAPAPAPEARAVTDVRPAPAPAVEVERLPPAPAPDVGPPPARAAAERPAPAPARPLPSFRPVATPPESPREAEASPLTLTLSEAIQLVHDSGGDAMELRFLRRELQRRGREGGEPPDLWSRIEQAVTGRLRRAGQLSEGQQLTLLRDPKVEAARAGSSPGS